jgi:glyoxylase-like metal-dependent hydrolase (beta-lactamase superfamily II)
MTWLKVLGVVLVGLVVAAVVGVRTMRGKFDPPREIKPGIAEVEAGGALVVAARVGTKVVLFDAGMDEEGRAVDALLKLLKASRGDVSDIFLTHGHPDHIAAVNLFPAARVHAGAGDAGWLAGTESSDLLLPRLMMAIMPSTTARLTHPMVGVNEVKLEEEKTVRCFPVPGHTPGSYVYLYDGVLIVGDVMRLTKERLAPLPGMVDNHPQENRQSVKALKPLLKDLTIDFVSTSHGGTTPPGQGRRMLDAHFAALGA